MLAPIILQPCTMHTTQPDNSTNGTDSTNSTNGTNNDKKPHLAETMGVQRELMAHTSYTVWVSAGAGTST